VQQGNVVPLITVNNVVVFGLTIIGLVFAFGRLFDAITDPLIGNISDNTRSRWGRRRPYILVGIILTGILLARLFNPELPEGDDTAREAATTRAKQKK
jgi:GPH family glycoside/pentoside/hexuronide:cation symporter